MRQQAGLGATFWAPHSARSSPVLPPLGSLVPRLLTSPLAAAAPASGPQATHLRSPVCHTSCLVRYSASANTFSQ